jgi:hypothetical protein
VRANGAGWGRQLCLRRVPTASTIASRCPPVGTDQPFAAIAAFAGLAEPSTRRPEPACGTRSESWGLSLTSKVQRRSFPARRSSTAVEPAQPT